MGSLQPPSEAGIPNGSQTMNAPLQMSGGDEQGTSPTCINFSFDQYGDEAHGGFEDRDDAKRRRIARVKQHGSRLWHVAD